MRGSRAKQIRKIIKDANPRLPHAAYGAIDRHKYKEIGGKMYDIKKEQIVLVNCLKKLYKDAKLEYKQTN